MKKLLIFTTIVFLACNDSGRETEIEIETPDPKETHPPTDALPDSADIKNDSLIVIDSSAI